MLPSGFSPTTTKILRLGLPKLGSELFCEWRGGSLLPTSRFAAGAEAILQFPNPQGGQEQSLGATEGINRRLHDVFIFIHYRACGLVCGKVGFGRGEFSLSDL